MPLARQALRGSPANFAAISPRTVDAGQRPFEHTRTIGPCSGHGTPPPRLRLRVLLRFRRFAEPMCGRPPQEAIGTVRRSCRAADLALSPTTTPWPIRVNPLAADREERLICQLPFRQGQKSPAFLRRDPSTRIRLLTCDGVSPGLRKTSWLSALVALSATLRPDGRISTRVARRSLG